MQHLLNSIDEQLAPWMKARGQGAYRVGQVRRWLFAQRARSFTEMTDLPQALREELAADFTLWNSTIARHTEADDGTEKLLLTLADGEPDAAAHPHRLARDRHRPRDRGPQHLGKSPGIAVGSRAHDRRHFSALEAEYQFAVRAGKTQPVGDLGLGKVLLEVQPGYLHQEAVLVQSPHVNL